METELVNERKNAAIGLDHSIPLKNPVDLDELIKDIGDARFVLLGDSTHGTHEFYYWRSHISKRLISEKNFNIICVEGDWPDCYLVNRFVKSYPFSGRDSVDILSNFNRWPNWLWGNYEMVAFLDWLKNHNSNFSIHKRVGFYGLDLFSLWESLDFLADYLKERDPLSYASVLKVQTCFENFKNFEGVEYGRFVKDKFPVCSEPLEYLLSNIRKNMFNYNGDEEADFNAEQNALVSLNAERYFHVMFSKGESAWNIRDKHMFDTVTRLYNYHGPDSKFIIWAHNNHVGDARFYDFGKKGFLNLGECLQEHFSEEGVYKVGFSYYQGDILASDQWSGEMKKIKTAKAKLNSWEQICHKMAIGDFYFFTRNWPEVNKNVIQRALGVVYDSSQEYHNYIDCNMKKVFDALFYIERGTALHGIKNSVDESQIPETFPYGL